MLKKDTKDRLIHWILEFDLEIQDKKGVKNIVADHLSCVPNAPSNEFPINNNFPNEQLLATFRESWFVDIFNYLVITKFYFTGQNKMYIGSCLKSDSLFGRDRISLNIIAIKSLGDVFPMRKWRVF